MATIKINNLRLKTIIGTKPKERKIKQPIVVNIAFDYDSSKASVTDNFKDALDYEALQNKIATHVKNSKYYLIEKLAKSILDIVGADSRVIKASVRIDKPKALPDADSVSVELTK